MDRRELRVVLITQDDPFYLGRALQHLLCILPSNIKIVGCVVLAVSPFGKRESFLQKALKTLKIFGAYFFTRYTIRYMLAKANRRWSVKRVMADNDIPIIELSKSINHPESINQIKSYEPDVLLSVAGNEIFKKEIINLASKGCLNLHSALLPKYRGLMPSFWVMKNGEQETGVSVFFVDEGIDSGPILVQKRIPIGDLSLDQLIVKTKMIGMEAVAEALNKITEGSLQTIENNDEEMTYYTFPTAHDVREFRKRGKRFF